VRGEVAPTLEAVRAADEELRVGEREPGLGLLANAPLDLLDGLLEAVLNEGRNSDPAKASKRLEPFARPVANGVGVGRTGGLDELLRPLPVLREIRPRRQRQGVHTKLLFRTSPGVRSFQAERRFVRPSSTLAGGHGPFRGQDAPLAPLRE
jgi:hypothetical protein